MRSTHSAPLSPAACQIEQILLADVEQRRAEQRRQLQIVALLLQHVAQRHQIEHPIWVVTASRSAPGVGNALADQRADDLRETAVRASAPGSARRRAAPPARAARAAARRIDPAADFPRDALRHLALARSAADRGAVVGQLSGSGSSPDFLDRRPQGHGRPARRGRCRAACPSSSTPRARVRLGENGVDGGQNVGQRAEAGGSSTDARSFEMHGGCRKANASPALSNSRGRRPGTSRSTACWSPTANTVRGRSAALSPIEELGGQQPHHLPLLAVGVLALVDEDDG
jgi:hypothetical protein